MNVADLDRVSLRHRFHCVEMICTTIATDELQRGESADLEMQADQL